jgi:hypothetical protein
MKKKKRENVWSRRKIMIVFFVVVFKSIKDSLTDGWTNCSKLKQFMGCKIAILFFN